MNFRYRLMQFMSGRYGTDNFTYILLIIAAVLSFVNIIVRSALLQLLVYFILFYALFRVLSRNIEARRKESLYVMEKCTFFKKKIDFYKQRKNDQCHVYKKCPVCKAVLRLPRRVGEHTTVCPRCGKEFKVKVKK